MRWISVLAATLTVAVGAATPAAAQPPDVRVTHFGGSGTSDYLCGFPVFSQTSVVVTTTTFFDAAGAPVRIETHNQAAGSFAGPTGLEATFDQIMLSSLDPVAGTQTVRGVSTRLTAPGAGVLLLDVGRLIFQLGTPPTPPVLSFEAGRHPLWEPGAWDPLCLYLAG